MFHLKSRQSQERLKVQELFSPQISIIIMLKQIVKFGDYYIDRDGHLLTLPSYMQFLLNLQPEEIVLEPVDIDDINRMASEFLGQ